MATGKNVTRATTITFGVSPNPNHSTNSGATMIIGTVWLATTIGYSTRRASADPMMITASTTPTTAPTSRPSIASDNVVST